jgi:hypothetical protein
MPTGPKAEISFASCADRVIRLEAEDVVIMTPMLSKPVKGARDVLSILNNAVRIASPIRYTLEVSDSKQTLLFWTGNAGDYALQAVTILKDGDDGLINEIRVLMRPWPIATIFRNAMYKALSSTIPAGYWELQPKPEDTRKPRHFTPISLPGEPSRAPSSP